MSASLQVNEMIDEEYIGLAECFQNYGIVKAAILVRPREEKRILTVILI